MITTMEMMIINDNNDCSTEERSVWNVKNVLQSFTNMVCYNNEAFSDA